MNLEPVIGLEVHVQLATESKLFCACRARVKAVAEEAANRHTCPVCAGHPGSLPVLNQKAVEYAIRAGLALECKINETSLFARKNYFYPDLPKGYQISQYEEPICQNGRLRIDTDSGEKEIRVQRIHMEEDAGKNLHASGYSLVNLNRAGVPLIEIVTHPDLSSPEEAVAYLKELYQIVVGVGICDGNLQEGNFRCDANISVRPVGSSKLGTRTELKNINSFRFVERALRFEIDRQFEVVYDGGTIVQETRLYDESRGTTRSMRSKEEAHDYRYFPDPDLLPLIVEEKWVQEVKSSLPPLPRQKRRRLQESFGILEEDARTLVGSLELHGMFEESAKKLKGVGDEAGAFKLLAKLLVGEVRRLENETHQSVKKSELKASALADLVVEIEKDAVSLAAGKQILEKLWGSGGDVSDLIDKAGLRQVSDEAELLRIVDQVLSQNAAQVAEFRAGKEKVLGFFVGQAMKLSRGKGNPKVLGELFRKKLKGE